MLSWPWSSSMDNLCRFSFLYIYMSLFLFVSYQINQHNFKLLLLFTIEDDTWRDPGIYLYYDITFKYNILQ